MKEARVSCVFRVSFSLGAPEDYPDSVASWRAAAAHDLANVKIGHAEGVDIVVHMEDIDLDIPDGLLFERVDAAGEIES